MTMMENVYCDFGSRVLHWTPDMFGAGPQVVNSHGAGAQNQINLNLNPKTFLYWLCDLGKVT